VTQAKRTDCSEVVMRVFEYIDNEMTQDDCTRVREHLDECGECLSEYQRDLVLKALVRRSCGCEAAPAALRMQIMAKITTVSVTYRE
jgi:mycothiol system anti-sigma-R factor